MAAAFIAVPLPFYLQAADYHAFRPIAEMLSHLSGEQVSFEELSGEEAENVIEKGATAIQNAPTAGQAEVDEVPFFRDEHGPYVARFDRSF